MSPSTYIKAYKTASHETKMICEEPQMPGDKVRFLHSAARITIILTTNPKCSTFPRLLKLMGREFVALQQMIQWLL
jgi:hypothetical protein